MVSPTPDNDQTTVTALVIGDAFRNDPRLDAIAAEARSEIGSFDWWDILAAFADIFERAQRIPDAWDEFREEHNLGDAWDFNIVPTTLRHYLYPLEGVQWGAHHVELPTPEEVVEFWTGAYASVAPEPYMPPEFSPTQRDLLAEQLEHWASVIETSRPPASVVGIPAGMRQCAKDLRVGLNPPKYNTAFSMAFSLNHDHDDPFNVPAADLIAGLEAKLVELRTLPTDQLAEVFEPFDTYDKDG